MWGMRFSRVTTYPYRVPFGVVPRQRTARHLNGADYAGNIGVLGMSQDSDNCPWTPGDLPGAGLEPAWSFLRGIFVPATAFTAESCDSFGVWTFSLPWHRASSHRAVGRGRQVSTLSLKSERWCIQRASTALHPNTALQGLARDCSHRRAVVLVPRI